MAPSGSPYLQAIEQILTPTDRNLPCQDANPQAFAQFLLGTVFSPEITHWTPAGLPIEERCEFQEPVTIRLLSSLPLIVVPPNIAKMTAISPNKSFLITILCNYSILLHGETYLIIPPPKLKGQISYLGVERYYQRLVKMKPRNAHLHNANLRCPELTAEEAIATCAVSDYGDICILREGGEVAIIDNVELLPGRPYTYQFMSPFSMLSKAINGGPDSAPHVVAYSCCFPPSSDNYLQCDSVLVMMRAIGRHTELTIERCMYVCPAATVDDLAIRGGVRRDWALKQLPTLTFKVSLDSSCPLSLSCSLAPFGTFAVVIYNGLHFTIPILHITGTTKHMGHLPSRLEPSCMVPGLCGRASTGDSTTGNAIPLNQDANVVYQLPKQPPATSPSNMAIRRPLFGSNKTDEQEPIPFRCSCNCTQLMPSFDARFSRTLESYMHWMETSTGSYVITHNLYALIRENMPHALRDSFSGGAQISWSIDGTIYCMNYAGMFIFGSVTGIFFRIKLKGVTTATVANGPLISFTGFSESTLNAGADFGFISGRLLAFRFGNTLSIFQVVLSYNKISIVYPERWSPVTHSLASCQLVRELPPATLSRVPLSDTDSYSTRSFMFREEIIVLAFLSYTFKDYELTSKILAASSSLEAKEIQENLGDGLNPVSSMDNMHDAIIATDISLYCQLLGMRVSMAINDLLSLIVSSVVHQNTPRKEHHLSKILTGAFLEVELCAYEAALVPLNVLRRRYTKEIPVLLTICADKVYASIIDTLLTAFGKDPISFFYQRLSDYGSFAFASTQDHGSESSESSDIFTQTSNNIDDDNSAGTSRMSFVDAHNNNKAICIMTVALLKLTALMVRSSYALSATHYCVPSSNRTLPYMNIRLNSCTIPGSTCLSLSCGFCCIAYDHCLYLASSCGENAAIRRELMQKIVLFLLCIHSLASKLQLYALDDVCLKMLSLIVPQSRGIVVQNAKAISLQSATVPLLPIYIINLCYPFLGSFGPISEDTLIKLKPHEKFIGGFTAKKLSEIPGSVVSMYAYLFRNTFLDGLSLAHHPYNHLYVHTVLHMIKLYCVPPKQGSKPHDQIVPSSSSQPTLSQLLYSAYLAGADGHLLIVVSYLLKVHNDTDYKWPYSDFSGRHAHTLTPNACLTRMQCEILSTFFTIANKLATKQALLADDFVQILSLRARTDPVLLDSLVSFLLYVTAYNVMLSLNCFLTYHRDAYTEIRCHCGTSHTPSNSAFGVATRPRHSIRFPDEALLKNLPKAVSPLFTPVCVALFLTAIGRIEDGVFLLARECYYSLGIHLLRNFLKFLPELSSTSTQSHKSSSKLNMVVQQWLIEVYSCKAPNLERLCIELETNQSVFNRLCGQERECQLDVLRSISPAVTESTRMSPLTPSRRTEPVKKPSARTNIGLTPTPMPAQALRLNPALFHVNSKPELGEILSTSTVVIDPTVPESSVTLDLDINSEVLSMPADSLPVGLPLGVNPSPVPPPPVPPPLPPSSLPIHPAPAHPPPLPPPPPGTFTASIPNVSAPPQPRPYTQPQQYAPHRNPQPVLSLPYPAVPSYKMPYYPSIYTCPIANSLPNSLPMRARSSDRGILPIYSNVNNVPYKQKPLTVLAPSQFPAAPVFMPANHQPPRAFGVAGRNPHPQQAQRPQAHVQQMSISSLVEDSTLSINDPYPPGRHQKQRVSSTVVTDGRTPLVLSARDSDASVDLSTQDYRNMQQYLNKAEPRCMEAPMKVTVPQKDVLWADISQSIEALDQLAAAARGTMNYLQELTREVEGNEIRLQRAKRHVA